MKAVILLLLLTKCIEGQIDHWSNAVRGRGPLNSLNPFDPSSFWKRLGPMLSFNNGNVARGPTNFQLQPTSVNRVTTQQTTSSGTTTLSARTFRQQLLQRLRNRPPRFRLSDETRFKMRTRPSTSTTSNSTTLSKHLISTISTITKHPSTQRSVKPSTVKELMTTKLPVKKTNAKTQTTSKSLTTKRTTPETTSKLKQKTTAKRTSTTTASTVTAPAVTLPDDESPDLRRVRRAIQRLVVLDKVWRARFVQLAFHDCFGGCDGCINLNDTANAGLPVILEKIDDIHWQHAPHWSRADVIAFAGAIASEVAVQSRTESKESIRIQYRKGRIDCTDPKNPPFRGVPHGNIINSTAILMKEFRITKRQAVALMGSHSIGEMHKNFSGFGDHSWDISENILDHGYFVELARIGKWKSEKVDNELVKSHHWIAETQNQTVAMLHADMSLLKKYDLVGEFERPSCSFNTCQNNTKTASVVIEYAHNISPFLKEYTGGFSKMIEKGLSYP